jgi:opacity protein-like surface antigen
MKRSHYRIIYCIIIIFLNVDVIDAQVNRNKFELGLSAASYIYQGDLTTHAFGSVETTRLGINIFGSKLLNESFAVRINLAVGGLRGDDSKYDDPEYRQQRNFRFKSPATELSATLLWNPLGRNYAERGFSPYLFGGIGLTKLKVNRDWSDYNAEYFDAISDVSARLVLDQQVNPPRVIPVIPAGIGLRYELGSRWAVNAEAAYRFTFTDYIDGFSQSVNPSRNDHYHTMSVGVVYKIGKKNMLACPTVR